MRTISFQTLLQAFADQARVARSNFSDDEKQLLCGDLNEAAHWLWTTATHSQALPDMMTGKTVTLAAGGIIAAAEINAADFWSVWVSDPREATQGSRGPLAVRATALGNGDVKVTDGAEGDGVFVIYKTPPPQWAVTLISEGVFAKDTLLWNAVSLPPILPDGHVYRAVQAGADWADIDGPDTAWWVQVTLPQSLQYLVVMRANYQRMRLGSKVPEAAGRERFALDQALEAAFMASEKQPQDKPWLYNFND